MTKVLLALSGMILSIIGMVIVGFTDNKIIGVVIFVVGLFFAALFTIFNK
jgi:uncharacterized membrane protein (Fun14 family)